MRNKASQYQANTEQQTAVVPPAPPEAHPRADGNTRQDAATTTTGDHAMLNANTQGKFVLFNIRAAERVVDGPVMRGFIELATAEGSDTEPVKINVAGWSKVARDTGTEYLGLKIGNNDPEHPDVYSVGPFYGRLFRQAADTKIGDKVRYWGFVEDAQRTGIDEDGRGVYATHWQLRINAKRQISKDGHTRYIAGTVAPGIEHLDANTDDSFAF